MGRRKAAANCRIAPWLSRKPNNDDKRFIQVGNSLLLQNSEVTNQFLNLSYTARYVYLCMCMEAGGKREFEFPRAAAKKYGIAPRTLIRSVDELVKSGMIERRSGKSARLPNVYRFCFDWKLPS